MKYVFSIKRFASPLVFFSAALLLVTVLAPPFRAYLQTQTPAKIDLNGTWKDGSHKVTITQIGSSVVAKYVEPVMCDPQDESTPKPRETDFVGTISGNTIDGEASVCNFGKSWGSKIGIQTAKMVLTISADQNTLSGTYDGYRGKKEMTLTRECDKGALCESVGQAIATMKGAISTPPSAAHYNDLKGEMSIQLSQIESNLCDDLEKSKEEIEALQRDLETLKYVQGQSNTENYKVLARLENAVKRMGVDLCGRSSTEIPPPFSCPQGNTAKTDADQTMLNSFRAALEQNLTAALAGPGTILKQSQTRKCLKEMLDQPCLPDGFFQNIKAAALAWSEGPPATEICKKACEAFGAWYISSPCSKGGLTEAAVVDKCNLTCKTSDISQ